MVVHELNFAAKYCTRILLLGEGRVLADAPPAEAFTEELLSRAYKADISVIKNPISESLEISTKPKKDDLDKAEALLKSICGGC